VTDVPSGLSLIPSQETKLVHTHCRRCHTDSPMVEGMSKDTDVLESVHVRANLTISRVT
jgi:hypothetical protein